MNPESETLDLIVVGAGPTGIAIGAEARRANLSVLLLDRGALTAAILNFPTYMTFFTTRDKLEIAQIPFTVPDEKPTRQQALVYYRAVAAHYNLPLALHEEVIKSTQAGGEFLVHSRSANGERVRRARALAFATGYFNTPQTLNIPGSSLPWIHSYYKDPYRHFGEDVVIVGGGNSACETALDLWRNGARSVTMVVRDSHVKETVKYWVRPDIENRISEGSIRAYFESLPLSFTENPRAVEIETRGKRQCVKADVVYSLIGFRPDADLERRCGIQVDGKSLVPMFDPETCESNVPGIYVAGTLQAGVDTHKIFIENSREHAPKIVRHLKARVQRQ